MEILIAEDDPRLGRYLEEAFRSKGWKVSTVTTYGALKERIENSAATAEPAEVAILDRMLFGDDTIELLPLLRTRSPQMKILFLSVVDSADQKANALDKGADDYMSKPFSLEELTARIHALSRRSSSSPTQRSTECRLGNLTLDLLGHNCFVDKKRVDLSNKEFRLLACLMERPGTVFNKYQLLEKVWDIHADIESNVVETTVRNVRRKLEDASSSASIQSRRNVGYWVEV